MILIPMGILIFGLGLICGVHLANWAIRRRVLAGLAQYRERKHQDVR